MHVPHLIYHLAILDGVSVKRERLRIFYFTFTIMMLALIAALLALIFLGFGYTFLISAIIMVVCFKITFANDPD